jgi:sulfate/thiosulfate transport system ATP-binding protein
MNVAVKNITKRYTQKGTPAVFEASFGAVSGGVTTLLGPSGSGKTTLLRLIAGLEIADSGHVLFEDRDVTQLPVRERDIGFVFQSFALFNHMTVSRNVAYALEVRGVAAAEKRRRVEELLALVQLEGYGDRYPRQLSGGQRQRVGFARALANNPRLLLLDEPFAALDTRVRVELRAWLAHLHRTTHLTTLLVTHDQEEALELSQRIVVMDHGKVVQVGAPHEIYDFPKTAQVASFIGGANVLQGRVQSRRAEVGTLAVAAPAAARDGDAVQVVVRPHNVRLSKSSDDSSELSLGRICTLRRVGGYVKLTVELSGGELVAVERPKSEIDALALAEGDRVFIDVGEAQVLVGDYAI